MIASAAPLLMPAASASTSIVRFRAKIPPTPVSRKPKPSGRPGNVPEMLANSAHCGSPGSRVSTTTSAPSPYSPNVERDVAEVAAGVRVVADEAAAARRVAQVQVETDPVAAA